MSSPTVNTIAYERGKDNLCQKVEYWNGFAKRRIDLFNNIDVIVLLKNEQRIKGVQVTSGSNHSAREKKAQATPAITEWVQCGGIFQVQSWRKNSKRKLVLRITQAQLVHNSIIFNEVEA